MTGPNNQENSALKTKLKLALTSYASLLTVLLVFGIMFFVVGIELTNERKLASIILTGMAFIYSNAQFFKSLKADRERC